MEVQNLPTLSYLYAPVSISYLADFRTIRALKYLLKRKVLIREVLNYKKIAARKLLIVDLFGRLFGVTNLEL
jgi:hypothetical protein